MLSLLTLVLAAHAAAAPAAPPPSPAPDARVLILGNSYIFQQDVDVLLEQVIEDTVPAWGDVEVVALTAGGLRFEDHLTEIETPGTTWYDALGTGTEHWDFVVLQGQSQIPGLPQDDPDWLSSLDAVVQLDQLARTAGADTVLMLTWGRRDGDQKYPERMGDFTDMQDALTAGYLAYADAIATDDRPVTVAPVGLAWAAIHDAYGVESDEFVGLYGQDGSHPSLAGGVLEVDVLAASIAGWSSLGARTVDPLEGDTMTWLQGVADGVTVDDPFAVVPFVWARPWSQWTGSVSATGGVRPTVGMVDPVGTVGSVDVGTTGAGRLWIDLDELTGIGTLSVGDDGRVLLENAALTVTSLAGVAGSTAVDQRGGSLVLAAGSKHSGDLSATGGQLTVDAITLDGALTTVGATLVLGTDAPADIQGPVDLHGPVQVAGSCPDGADVAVLLLSEGLVVEDDALQSATDAGLSIGTIDERPALILPCAASQDTGSADTGATSTADGCGCASTRARRAPWWAALILLLPWRRRRR